MKNPIRGHADVFFGGESPTIECSAAEDMARQEYALSSDLAYQIQRFGVGHHTRSGVVDFDHLDLTSALALVERSQQQWLELPKVVRDRYQSWANVEKAAQTGELQQLLKAAGAPAVVAGGPAASPSEAPAGSSA